MKINIPKPCSENWDKMSPKEKGRYCLSCNKVVVDFTEMTIEEIHEYFLEKRKEEVCGIFNVNDIANTNQYWLTRYKNIVASFFLGSMLFLGSCFTKHRVTGKVAVREDKTEIDSDDDGLIDLKDQCPYEAGTISNNGCPEQKENKHTLGKPAISK